MVLLKPQLVGSSLLNEKNNLDKLPENLIIQAKDLIDLEVDVDLSEPVKPPHEFKTDADISGKMQIKERELERWVPDDEVELTLRRTTEVNGTSLKSTKKSLVLSLVMMSICIPLESIRQRPTTTNVLPRPRELPRRLNSKPLLIDTFWRKEGWLWMIVG